MYEGIQLSNAGKIINLESLAKTENGELILSGIDTLKINLDDGAKYKTNMEILENNSDVKISLVDAQGNDIFFILKNLNDILLTNNSEIPVFEVFEGTQTLASLTTVDDLEAAAAGGQTVTSAQDGVGLAATNLEATTSDDAQGRVGGLIGAGPLIPVAPGVGNSAPLVFDVALSDIEVLGAEGEGSLNTITGTLTVVDADPEDTGLHTFTAIEGSLVVTSIDEDGNPTTVITVDDDAITVVLNPDGTFVITGDFNDLADGEIANVSFSYFATDIEGATSNAATVTLTVQGTNDIPVVQDVNVNEQFEDGIIFETSDSSDSNSDNDSDNIILNQDGNNFYKGNLAVFDDDDSNTHTFNIDEEIGVTLKDEQGTDVTLYDEEGNELNLRDFIDIYPVNIEGSEVIDHWEYSIDGNFTSLFAGQVVTLEFSYYADDQRGFDGTDGINESSESQRATISLTITGTNDQPNITFTTANPSVNETVVSDFASEAQATKDEAQAQSNVERQELLSQQAVERTQEQSSAQAIYDAEVLAKTTQFNDEYDAAVLQLELDAQTAKAAVIADAAEYAQAQFDAKLPDIAAAMQAFYDALESKDQRAQDAYDAIYNQTAIDALANERDQKISDATDDAQDVFDAYMATVDARHAQELAEFDTQAEIDAQTAYDSVQDVMTTFTGVISGTDADYEDTHEIEFVSLLETPGQSVNIGSVSKPIWADIVFTAPNNIQDDELGNEDLNEGTIDLDISDIKAFSIVLEEIVDANGLFSYEYTVSGNFNALAAGEIATITFQVQVNDSSVDVPNNEPGSSKVETITLQVLGTNDKPVIISTEESDSITETTFATKEEQESTDTSTLYTGKISGTDDDLTNMHDFNFVDISGNYTSNIKVELESSNNEADGENGVDLDINDLIFDITTKKIEDDNGKFEFDYTLDGNFNALAEGEKAIITFEYFISDRSSQSNESSDSEVKTVTLVVTGTNDTPKITEITGIAADGSTDIPETTIHSQDIEDIRDAKEVDLRAKQVDLAQEAYYNVYEPLAQQAQLEKDIAIQDGIDAANTQYFLDIEQVRLDAKAAYDAVMNDISNPSASIIDAEEAQLRVFLLGKSEALEDRKEAIEESTRLANEQYDDDIDAAEDVAEDARTQFNNNFETLVTETRDSVTDENTFVRGEITGTDEDLTDEHTISYANMSAVITKNNGGSDLSASDITGLDVLFTKEEDDNGKFEFDYTFLGNFNALGLGEQATVSFDIVINDEHSKDANESGTVTQTLTFTVTGTNDQPEITSNHDSAVKINETIDADITPNTLGTVDDVLTKYSTLTAPGAVKITGTDMDDNDNHVVVLQNTQLSTDTITLTDITDLNANNPVTASIVLTDENGTTITDQDLVTSDLLDLNIKFIPSASNANESFTFDYEFEGNFNALAKGEIATIKFDYLVRDSSSASDESQNSEYETITLVITGTNDRPEITSNHGAVKINETIDADITPNTSGAVDDVLTVYNTAAENMAVKISGIDLDDTDEHTIKVVNAASATTDNTIEIKDMTNNNTVNASIVFANESANYLDKDDFRDLEVTFIPDTSNGNGSFIYDYEFKGNFNALGEGKTATVKFDVIVNDGNTAVENESANSVVKTITLEIQGTNDRPEVVSNTLDEGTDGIDLKFMETSYDENNWATDANKVRDEDKNTTLSAKFIVNDLDVNDTHTFKVQSITAEDITKYGHGSSDFVYSELSENGKDEVLITSDDITLTADTIKIDSVTISTPTSTKGKTEADVTLVGNFNALGAGEKAIVVVKYNADDASSSLEESVSEDGYIEIEVMGTNDQPVVQNVTVPKEIESTSITGLNFIDGKFTTKDIDEDQNDTHTYNVLSIDRNKNIETEAGMNFLRVEGVKYDSDNNGAYEGRVDIAVKLPASSEYKLSDLDIHGIKVNGADFELIGNFNALPKDEVLTIKFLYNAVDDSDQNAPGNHETNTSESKWVTIEVQGTQDNAVISYSSGENIGEVVENLTTNTKGKLDVEDYDAGEFFETQTNKAYTYGKFNIDEQGNWHYVLDHSKVEFLSKGQEVKDIITVNSEDKQDNETITITIKGTNDDPTVTSETLLGSVTEDETNKASSTETVTGTIVLNDVDLDDIYSAQVLANTNKGVLTASVVQDKPDATSEVITITWIYTIDNSKVQYLADTESLIENFTLNITSNNGDTVTKVIQATVKGTNDAPEIIVDTTKATPDSVGANISETNNDLTASGTVTVKDVDTTDVVTAAVNSVVVTGVGGTNPSLPDNATLKAMLSVDPTTILNEFNVKSELDWTFDSNGEAFDYLAKGDILTLTYTISVTDDATSSLNDIQEIVIQITGTNDLPKLTVETGGGDFVEAVTANDASGNQLTTTGGAAVAVVKNLSLTDVDLDDEIEGAIVEITNSKTADLIFVNSTYTFPAGISIDSANSTATKIILTGKATPFEYKAAIEAIQFTNSSDTPNEDDRNISIKVTDGQTDDGTPSGSLVYVEATSTVSVTASNDAPKALPNVDDVKEAGYNQLPDNNVKGNLITDVTADSDVDNAVSELSISAIKSGAKTVNTPDEISGLLEISGEYGTLTINPLNGAYKYVLDENNSDVDELNVGDDLTETFTYTLSDGALEDISTLTITINGTNDAPTIEAITNSIVDTSVTDDFSKIAGFISADDIDNNDNQSILTYGIEGVTDTNNDGKVSKILTYGTLTVTIATGEYEYEPNDSAINALTTGDTPQDQVNITVTDSNNVTTSNTFTVNVTGTNDITITEADTKSTNEDMSVSGNVLTNDSDVDTADNPLKVDTFTVQGMANTTYTAVEVNDNSSKVEIKSGNDIVGELNFKVDGSYTFTPTQDWNGQVPTITYTTSTNKSSTLDITVTPVNDSPTTSALTKSLSEDDSSFSMNLLSSANDVDNTNLDINNVSIFVDSGQPVPNWIEENHGITYTVDNDTGVFSLDPNQFDYLKVDDTLTFTVNYNITDGENTIANSATITVNGKEDGASISATAYKSGAATYGSSNQQNINVTDETGENPLNILKLDTDGNVVKIKSIDVLRSEYTPTSDTTISHIFKGNIAPNNSAAHNDAFSFELKAGETANFSILSGNSTYSVYMFSEDTRTWELVNPISGNPDFYEGEGSYVVRIIAVQSTGNSSVNYELRLDINAPSAPITDEATVKEDTATFTDGSTTYIGTKGFITVNDDDRTQDFFNTIVDKGSNLGELSINEVGQWMYKIDNSLVNEMGEYDSNDPLTYKKEVFTVSSVDGTTHDIKILVKGTNDAPEITTETTSVNENSQVSGTITFSDIDGTATVAVTNGNPIPTGLTLFPDGNYVFNADSYDYLSAGEIKVIKVPLTVTDNNGATAQSTLTITVTGTDDDPKVQVITPVSVNENLLSEPDNNDTNPLDENSTFSGTLPISETDVSEAYTYTQNPITNVVTTGPITGTTQVTVNPNGTYEVHNPSFNNLAHGEIATVSFGYIISDTNDGDADTGIITLQISGSNDKPTVQDETITSVDETDGLVVIHTGLLNVDDQDTSDSHTFGITTEFTVVVYDTDGQTVRTPQFDLSSVDVVITDTSTGAYKVEGNFDALATGQKAVIEFGYKASDNSMQSNAQSDEATVTLTVNGTNDSAQLEYVADVNSLNETLTAKILGVLNVQDIDNALDIADFNIGGNYATLVEVKFNSTDNQYELWLKENVVLDFENISDSSLDLTVSYSDSQTVDINIPVNNITASVTSLAGSLEDLRLTHWELNDKHDSAQVTGGNSTSSNSVNDKLDIYGDASFNSNTGIVAFNGDGDYLSGSDSNDINLGITEERTIIVTFKADRTGTGTQMIYEQGGKTRGLNIYLDSDGKIVVGGWNDDSSQSNWSGDWIIGTSDLRDGKWHQVALVYKGNNDSDINTNDGTLEGFIDGSSFGSISDAGLLYQHSDDFGVGAVVSETKLNDNVDVSSTSNFFKGEIDELITFDKALTSGEVSSYASGGIETKTMTLSAGEINMAQLLSQANDFVNSDDLTPYNLTTDNNMLDENFTLIDLTGNNHILSNINISDVLAMTSDDNTLKIEGDSGDKIELNMNDWQVDTSNGDMYDSNGNLTDSQSRPNQTDKDGDGDGYVTYVDKSGNSDVQLLIDENIDVKLV